MNDPQISETQKTEVRFEPLWYVVLYDDQDHTYDYVVAMLVDLFRMPPLRALQHAFEVDSRGVTVLARLPKRQAADKRDQVLRYGGDPLMKTSVSMRASIEPADD